MDWVLIAAQCRGGLFITGNRFTYNGGMTVLIYPKIRVLSLFTVKYDTGESIHLFAPMKLTTITWCAVLTALYRLPKEISEWQEGFWFEARRRPQALSAAIATRPTTPPQAKSTLLPILYLSFASFQSAHLAVAFASLLPSRFPKFYSPFRKLILAFGIAATILSAPAATLSEGDLAPKLTVSKWVQGEPVKAFQPGTIYLVEFWATWWTPCKEAMAHLNRLHHKYQDKGLVVIGQNVKEPAATRVELFIKRMGGLVSYRVALDEGATNRFSGKMLENWLYAAEAGIPTAFIIDKKGKISFIGHPEEIDEELIEQVLAGTFDAKKRGLTREAVAAKDEAWETHNELGKAAWKAKEWGKATSEIDEMEKLFPHRRTVTQCLRITVFIGQENFDAAGKLALQLSNDNRDDPFLQHRVARTIANRAPTNSVILNQANLLMERAIALTKGPEPEFLHTQARLAFLEGKKERAIQLETEAVGLADPETRDQFEQALNGFKRGKLPQ
jgi:thiol-disulfide isomerase/thioredoxin